MKKVLQYLVQAAAMLSVLSCNTDGIGGGTVQVTTLDARYVTKSTVELCGATWGGVQNMLARGVCFSKDENVGFSDGKISVYPGEGEFSKVTHELEALTTYYMRAYAVMNDGAVHYGELKSFSTLDFTPAVIEIGEVTDILSMEATVNATIVSRGDYDITSCGFVYSEDPSPEVGKDGCTAAYLDTVQDDMSATLYPLGLGTGYYVRAFAVSQDGIVYSDQTEFTTKDIPPVEFSEIEIVDNDYTSICISCTVIDANGTITSKGFCWSATENMPDVGDSSVELDGDMSYLIEGVMPNEVYYIRPWGVNEAGIGYGPVLKVRVRSYATSDNMVLVSPPQPVWIGWLGDPAYPANVPTFTSANDGAPEVNQFVDRDMTAGPSKAALDDYMAAKYEVTCGDYADFLNLYGSRTVKDGPYAGKELLYYDLVHLKYDSSSGRWSAEPGFGNRAIGGVTWYGANEFCEFFGGYLPTEAQWECAARGAVYSDDEPMYRFSGSNDLDEVAVYNTGTEPPAEVGTKKPNPLGIYDMSGNAQEWTRTWWHNYSSTYKEPATWMNANNISKTCRGGRCQRGVTDTFGVAKRDAMKIDEPNAGKDEFIGFRFFCDPFEE